MKRKLTDLEKAKLVYSGELIIIAIVFLVIGLLRITGVTSSEKSRTWFNYLTLVGGIWMISDFFWALFSKKRREKVSLLDKILTLPLASYLITFDLYCLINKISNGDMFKYGLPIAFFYIFVIYMFEGIYHWFKPLPQIVEEAKELEKKEEK